MVPASSPCLRPWRGCIRRLYSQQDGSNILKLEERTERMIISEGNYINSKHYRILTQRGKLQEEKLPNNTAFQT
jgi:hypothetical protein